MNTFHIGLIRDLKDIIPFLHMTKTFKVTFSLYYEFIFHNKNDSFEHINILKQFKFAKHLSVQCIKLDPKTIVYNVNRVNRINISFENESMISKKFPIEEHNKELFYNTKHGNCIFIVEYEILNIMEKITCKDILSIMNSTSIDNNIVIEILNGSDSGLNFLISRGYNDLFKDLYNYYKIKFQQIYLINAIRSSNTDLFNFLLYKSEKCIVPDIINAIIEQKKEPTLRLYYEYVFNVKLKHENDNASSNTNNDNTLSNVKRLFTEGDIFKD